MRLLARYIATETLRGVAMTVLVLVAVASFVDLVGQFDDVGTGDYGFVEALSYVALRLPRMVFEVLPAAALIGTLLGLGNLAVHRELVVMRASGVSNIQLLSAVGAAGLVLVLVMVMLGESLAPSLGAYAREMRTQALHEDVEVEGAQSTWLKDGDRIWNLRRQQGEVEFESGVLLFELEDGRLRQVARADSASFGSSEEWLLANYAETRFTGDVIEVEQERLARRPYRLSPDLLELSEIRQDLLDTPALRRYIRYLHENELDARRYEIAYWSRVASMVSVLLMTVLALPFVFGGLRSAGTGGRLLAGLVIGLSYYVATQMLVSSGEVFDLDPRVVAWAPSGVLLLVTAIAFTRLR
ncbi:MAG: LPS export ABC transporter permease LptG [Gammaproteobacteria bacterium]|nr:LPS export ABC transporter permease LptG [Gammaproteobacteria bacterium]